MLRLPGATHARRSAALSGLHTSRLARGHAAPHVMWAPGQAGEGRASL